MTTGPFPERGNLDNVGCFSAFYYCFQSKGYSKLCIAFY